MSFDDYLRCPSCGNTAVNGNLKQGYECPDCGYYWIQEDEHK